MSEQYYQNIGKIKFLAFSFFLDIPAHCLIYIVLHYFSATTYVYLWKSSVSLSYVSCEILNAQATKQTRLRKNQNLNYCLSSYCVMIQPKWFYANTDKICMVKLSQSLLDLLGKLLKTL